MSALYIRLLGIFGKQYSLQRTPIYVVLPTLSSPAWSLLAQRTCASTQWWQPAHPSRSIPLSSPAHFLPPHQTPLALATTPSTPQHLLFRPTTLLMQLSQGCSIKHQILVFDDKWFLPRLLKVIVIRLLGDGVANEVVLLFLRRGGLVIWLLLLLLLVWHGGSRGSMCCRGVEVFGGVFAMRGGCGGGCAWFRMWWWRIMRGWWHFDVWRRICLLFRNGVLSCLFLIHVIDLWICVKWRFTK